MSKTDITIRDKSLHIIKDVNRPLIAPVASIPKEKHTTTISYILHRTFSGGLSGAGAMAVQVGTLMWLNTIMLYQCRHGTSFFKTISKLYSMGGFRRFYRGFSLSIIQGPCARFGDTAANSAALIALSKWEKTSKLPLWVQTSIGSVTAALFRILIMPLDTVKSVLQVEGSLKLLRKKISVSGVRVLFHGSTAYAGATFMGHFPWFLTYNYLNHIIDTPRTKRKQAIRNGSLDLGFSASFMADVCSNSARVIKTYKQTFHRSISYLGVIRNIIQETGVRSLLFRGLGARVLIHGINSVVFTITWRELEDYLNHRPK